MNSKMDDGLKSRSTKVSGSISVGFSRSELKLLNSAVLALIEDVVWAREKEKNELREIAKQLNKAYGSKI